MKVKNPETDAIENVKFLRDSDDYVEVEIAGETYCGHIFLLFGFEIVDIDRSDLKDFHDFLMDARFVLSETNDFFNGKMEAWNEQHEEGKEE